MPVPSDEPFSALQAALGAGGPAACLDGLVESLRAQGKLPQLFEALLLRKRHQLGLALEGTEALRDLPESVADELEREYVEICRTVGRLFLERGDIPGAWPYFRAIDEPGPVSEALESWRPPEPGGPEEGTGGLAGGDDTTDRVIDIAFREGANPRRGYELILSHHGTCRAITVLEHQFPHGPEVREESTRRLVEQLHRELRSSLRAAIERQEGAAPPGESSVPELLEGRPRLFEGHGYHVDISHLQSVVRAATCLASRRELAMAVELCDYGRKLSRELQVSERPPFEDTYNDYRIFLRALLGEGADGAVRYFTAKADRHGPDEDGNHLAGEVLVYLLHRLGRHREALAAYLKYLRRAPGPLSVAPSLARISEAAGDYAALLEVSREKDDLLGYATALVKERAAREGQGSPPPGTAPPPAAEPEPAP